MIHNISWQQYITALIILTTLWYAYVGLGYYRSDLAKLLRLEPTDPSPLPPVAGQMSVVMGKAKPESDTGIYGSQELIFSAVQPDEISDQTLPKGQSDDLLAEAQVLIDAYSDNDDKAGFLSLFQLLLDKYEVFAEEISLPQIIKALHTSELPFSIKADEWPQTFAA